MVKNKRERKKNGDGVSRKKKNDLEDDIAALFQLPLTEFTGARNTLAARLKRDGRRAEADQVRVLGKPPISAWAVNQLYWQHQETFDQLLAAGERFRQAQTSSQSGKVADMRKALDARREALAELSDMATTLLHDAGHNPALDTIRRITATLEALSAFASHPDGPTPGRLTYDVDPPGFESLTSFGVGKAAAKPSRTTTTSATRAPKKEQPAEPATDGKNARRLEEAHRAKIAAARVSLQDAKRVLSDARSKAQKLEIAQKKAGAQVKRTATGAKKADKDFREAELRFKKASAASEEAAERARNLAEELEEATKTLEEAQRTVEKGSKELERLFRESPVK